MKKSLLSVAFIGALAIGFSGCSNSSTSVSKPKYNPINTYSEEEQIKAVHKKPSDIKYIRKPSFKVQQTAINKAKEKGLECVTINTIKNPNENLAIELLDKCGFTIKFIKNPTVEQQLLAVKVWGENIKHIENPPKEVQIEAVKNKWESIEYIKNPVEEAQLIAVKNGKWHTISEIKNPTEKVKLAAVKYNGKAIRYIDNPSEELQLMALKSMSANQRKVFYKDIKNPTKSVKKLYWSTELKRNTYGFNFIGGTTCDNSNKDCFYSLYSKALDKIKLFQVKNEDLKVTMTEHGALFIDNNTNNFIKLDTFTLYYGNLSRSINLSANKAISPNRVFGLNEAVKRYTRKSRNDMIKDIFWVKVNDINSYLEVGIALQYSKNGQVKTLYEKRPVNLIDVID